MDHKSLGAGLLVVGLLTACGAASSTDVQAGATIAAPTTSVASPQETSAAPTPSALDSHAQRFVDALTKVGIPAAADPSSYADLGNMVCSYIKADPTVNGLRKLVVALANNDTLSALTSPQRAVILGRSIGVLCPDRAGLLTVYKAQTKRDAKLLVAARNAGLTDSDEILLSSAQAVCEIEQGSGDPVADMAVAVMSGGFTQQDKLADFVGVIVDHNFCQW